MKLLLVATMLSMLLLSACGKKGAPEPAGPRDQVTFPRTYPAR